MASNDTDVFQYLLAYLHEGNSFQGLQRCSRLGEKAKENAKHIKKKLLLCSP